MIWILGVFGVVRCGVGFFSFFWKIEAVGGVWRMRAAHLARRGSARFTNTVKARARHPSFTIPYRFLDLTQEIRYEMRKNLRFMAPIDINPTKYPNIHALHIASLLLRRDVGLTRKITL